MGGGMDPLSTTTGSRRRATMPADVLETQVCAQGVASVVARCSLLARRLSAAGAREAAACVISRPLAHADADARARFALAARRTSSCC